MHKHHQTLILTNAGLQRLILSQSNTPCPARIALYKYIYSLNRTRYQDWYAVELHHLLVVGQISQGQDSAGLQMGDRVEVTKSLLGLWVFSFARE